MLQPLHSKGGFRGTNSFLGSRRSQPSLPTTAAPARLSLIQLLQEVKAQQLYKPGNNRSAGSEAGGPHQMNKRKKTNRGRNKDSRDRLVIIELPLGIYPPSLAASWLLVSPSPPLSHPATPAGSGAAFSNAILAAAGKAAPLQGWRHLGRLPPLFLFLALAAGTPELAGIYLKFPSKPSSHRLGEGFLSASAFVWLLLQRCR